MGAFGAEPWETHHHGLNNELAGSREHRGARRGQYRAFLLGTGIKVDSSKRALRNLHGIALAMDKTPLMASIGVTALVVGTPSLESIF